MTREEYLKQLILEDSGTLKDFAQKIKMPYTTLHSILKNVGGAAIDKIFKICEGLGINADDLAKMGEGKPTRQGTPFGSFEMPPSPLGYLPETQTVPIIQPEAPYINTILNITDRGRELSVGDDAFAPRICSRDIALTTSLYEGEKLQPHKSILAIQAVDQNGFKLPNCVVLRLFYYSPDLKGIVTYAPTCIPMTFPTVEYTFDYLNKDRPIVGVVRAIRFNVS